MNLVLIHGANSTSHSWNYLVSQLKKVDKIYTPEYEDSLGFDFNLNYLKMLLSNYENMFLVGHSLGGIYATHLADKLKGKVIGGLTISTPYGGSQSAQYLKYLTMWNYTINQNFLNDITPNSKPMVTARNIQLEVPWKAITTTGGGIPILGEPNDSVVTVKSMKAKNGIEYENIEMNHFEVLQHPLQRR